MCSQIIEFYTCREIVDWTTDPAKKVTCGKPIWVKGTNAHAKMKGDPHPHPQHPNPERCKKAKLLHRSPEQCGIVYEYERAPDKGVDGRFRKCWSCMNRMVREQEKPPVMLGKI